MFDYTKAKLKNIEVFEYEGIYRLKVVYEYENKNGRYELTIPNIILPITKDMIPDIKNDCNCRYGYEPFVEEYYIENPFGRLDVDTAKIHEPGSDFEGVYFIKTLETFPKKMTVEEIEKSLGYKIEIVSRKE